ncbi:MAG: DUF2905 domain-containing protein [Bacillaceae bacterium]|nr:DUF2905 domain-containing protein [Bacillaceae bacterium]
MEGIGKMIVTIGLILVVIGLLVQFTGFGRLPGDIIIRKGNTTFYFPIVTCLLLSVILTLILFVISRFR